MPTHWESSTRPLYVKTVLVNGSRHAILTPQDPLIQNLQVNKVSRPNSPQSGSSSGVSSEPAVEDCRLKSGVKNKCSRDLQSCLVKLRVVLATQEHKKPVNKEIRHRKESVSKRRKGSEKNYEKTVSCGCKNSETDSPSKSEGKAISIKNQTLDINHNITVAAFFNEPKTYHCAHYNVGEDSERIIGQTAIDAVSVIPTLGIGPDFDVPWNNVTADNYFTRPFYNRLSERVLQWIDMSNRGATKCEEITEVKKSRNENTRKPLLKRSSSEANEDEVRRDEDVETALSLECPKFSQELNRQHILKTALPEKSENYNEILQETIAESFSSAIRSVKYVEHERYEIKEKTSRRRKGYLTRQVRVDENDERNETFNIWDVFRRTTEGGDECLFGKGKRNISWQSSRNWSVGESKPQLHIFIPALPDEEQMSDNEISSD